MTEQDHLYFTIGSDRLTSNFQGWGVTVREWRQGSDRVDALFQCMANSLNSNENFELEDSFQVSITHVHQPPRGAGKKRKLKPRHQASTRTIYAVPEPSSRLGPKSRVSMIGNAYVEDISDEEEVEVDEEEEEKEVLYVFFDIEAMQLQGCHEANLLVAETCEDDKPHVSEL